MEDDAILSLFRERSENALSETEAKYGRLCYSVAYRILEDSQDSEECVNDTWMQAWNAIPPEWPRKLSAWLSRVTRNLAVSRFREKHAEKRGGSEIPLILDELAECLAGGTEPERELERKELAAAINGFLAGLKQEERDLFTARYFYAASHKELAERTGFSIPKIKTVLHRNRVKLMTYLKEEGLC
ncbi:MAG: RNA polymerase sigma factor [Oscillospiraceae bacterium]|nr:RNA polymerase sigma factor [Oscillospiraceae bacterium]